MPKEKGKKADWEVVSARIPPDLKSWIVQKHKGSGCINDLIFTLLKKYREGRIFLSNISSQ